VTPLLDDDVSVNQRSLLVAAGILLAAELARACATLPLHVAAGLSRPPSFVFAADVTSPHTRTGVSVDEMYRVGDPTGGDGAILRLFAISGSAAGDVILYAEPPCTGNTSFADSAVYLRDLHVATTGSPSGDGSPANPFDRLDRIQAVAQPGDFVIIHEGSYPGSAFLTDIQGTATSPIRIGGAAGEAPPVLGSTSVSEAIHLIDPAYLVLEDLEVAGPTGNGINIDDGGDYSTPAHHVVVRGIAIHDIGAGGNQDCLKLSGLDSFWVLSSNVERCGSGGSGVDMVGCHDGLIAGNAFRDTGSNAIQAKGGSSEVTIHGNLMVDAGARAMNLGGSTGPAFFRPPGANYEARDIRALANVIIRSEAPTAFVGCDGCLVANNTFYLPQRWVTRILQETTTPGFIQCRDGRFVNNIVVFDSASLSTFVNVGPNTLPDTFTFANNLWFSRDDPGFGGPSLPVVETDPVIQQDPLFLDPAAADFHLDPSSPALDRGICLPEIDRDRDGVCYGDPPTLGAYDLR